MDDAGPWEQLEMLRGGKEGGRLGMATLRDGLTLGCMRPPQEQDQWAPSSRVFRGGGEG